MLEVIQRLYSYNTWATEKLLTALEQLSAEQYTAPGCSGHGSIRDTLAHLLAVHYSWFAWFQESMTLEQAIGYTIDGNEIPSVSDARKRWADVDTRAREFIDRQTEGSVVRDQPFTLPNGLSSALSLWKMLLQPANHGTHTRAQIVAAIRRAGFDPGNYDLIGYLLMTLPKRKGKA
jgi:uncharacterized damage-inducible protein DinB